ncbi:hypothetical protein CEXT_114701 [Caerostris extrusa]|uniref:Uncharacterized protein n=1 Tax=Caerostris extrusa TaxID=172846 RepID=A0AAV4X7V9_CAEEX|nr:hypothetical protein CEXT_114701 [Caerostris extrusa]
MIGRRRPISAPSSKQTAAVNGRGGLHRKLKTFRHTPTHVPPGPISRILTQEKAASLVPTNSGFTLFGNEKFYLALSEMILVRFFKLILSSVIRTKLCSELSELNGFIGNERHERHKCPPPKWPMQ